VNAKTTLKASGDESRYRARNERMLAGRAAEKIEIELHRKEN